MEEKEPIIQTVVETDSPTPTEKSKSKNNVVLFLSILVIILLGFIVYLIFINTQLKQQLSKTHLLEDSDPVSFDTAEFSPNSTIERQASKCYENDDYLVIVHPENRNFLIKYKDKNEANYDCVYRIDLTDFEIINRGTDWYLGLQNNFLFIDTGTGPGPRELMIYDIEKRLKVHESLYSPPVDIKSGYIDYWKEVSIEVTRENCPEKDFWEGGGLGTAIEQRVRFDLISLKETNLDDFRCEPRQ